MLNEKLDKVVQESVSIEPYNPIWPQLFKKEKNHLLSILPDTLIQRIVHFGSTAVPGLGAKPIIDMLVGVTSLKEVRKTVAPLLESQGYDYFWRPTWGDNTPPFYAWFIKRNSKGIRTHHIHMVEKNFEHWDRLLFKDYLIEHPDIAREYEQLKSQLAKEYGDNRVVYTQKKSDFIEKITSTAKQYYQRKRPSHCRCKDTG